MKAGANSPLHSSANDNHCTPKPFFNYVERVTGIKFTLDAAATKQNTLCKYYITEEEDALKQDWHRFAKGGAIWVNPPYSLTYEFVEKALSTAIQGTHVVMLLASRTGSAWWADFICPQNIDSAHATLVQFIRGRLRFVGNEHDAPFDSILVHFEPSCLFAALETETLFPNAEEKGKQPRGKNGRRKKPTRVRNPRGAKRVPSGSSKKGGQVRKNSSPRKRAAR